MENPRSSKQSRTVDLNVQENFVRGILSRRMRWLIFAAVVLMIISMGVWLNFKPETYPMSIASSASVSGLKTQLAETRVESAFAKLEQNRPDEALAVLVTALESNPQFISARQLAEKILRETTWHFPVLEMQHPAPISHITQGPSASSLWVALTGNFPTLVRWNLDSLQIESVLFPLQDEALRSIVMDPTGRRLVVERAGILLLCDAQTLKPLRDLGKLPETATPSSVIVFSADGLLMAHPILVNEPKPSWVWQIRDTASGEILRSSAPRAMDMAQPLSAHLDRQKLRVLHADGELLDISVSPVEAEVVTAALSPVKMLHACHADDGETALVLSDRGPHQFPELKFFPEGKSSVPSLESTALLERFPWSRQPGIWTGLFRDVAGAPIFVDGSGLGFARENTAPIFVNAAISAVAVRGQLCMMGCEDGTLMFQRALPLPAGNEACNENKNVDEAALAAFKNLAAALAAVEHEEAERRFVMIDAAERRRRFDACDFVALRRLFPSLDFQPLIAVMAEHAARDPSPDAMKILLDRLDRANPSQPAVPAVVNLHTALSATDAAKIRECLAAAQNVPPLVRKLAESRIAWLDNRRGDAMAAWSDDFPDLAQVRLREDWDGWEQIDFREVLDGFHKDMQDELAKLELPENHNAEQRRDLLDKLTNPETLRAVGRKRLGSICLKAALTYSEIASEAKATLVLVSLARAYGQAPEACLRAEARAFSQLGEHMKAHDRWILLFTEYPVENHEPADYADAAYTAFETANPRQSIEILTAGLQRFPENSDYALRAGWIALLTGNPEKAYGFLLAGRQVGYAEDKIENATVLLAIAAAQSGQTDDAAALFEELITLNPTWSDPKTIKKLTWPEDLKATLRQLSL